MPAAAPLAGIVLADGDPHWGTSVCGLTVLTRAIAALDRAGAAVFVLPDALAPDLRARVEAELARMPRRPEVRFTPAPAEPSRRLVVAAPGVFDHRLVDADGLAPDAVVAVVRPGAARPAFLWATGTDAPGGLEPDLLAERQTAVIDPGAGLCERLDEATPAAIAGKLFDQARKTSDTWVARTIDRRLSLAITRRLVPWPVTPNQITFAATGIGLAGAVLLACGTYATQLAGAVLLTLAIIVDGCDGEVARIKFMESEFGRRLDFFLDNVVNVAAIFAVGAGHAWQGGEPLYLWASTLAALAAAASVLPVYALFFREAKSGVQLGAAAPAASDRSLAALLEAIAGRDFAYLILVLAVFGRAHWFALVCVAGIAVFLAAVLGVLVTSRRPVSGASD